MFLRRGCPVIARGLGLSSLETSFLFRGHADLTHKTNVLEPEFHHWLPGLPPSPVLLDSNSAQPPKDMSIKLTYFSNMRGRAETSRLVLYAAKKPFTDHTLSGAEWAKLKPKTPFGSLPVLEIGGEQYGQSGAVATYLARENGLYGSSNLEGLQIDQLHQLREDLIIEEVKAHFEKDPARKAELANNLRETTYPRFLGYFTRALKDNKAKNHSDFVVGKKLSLADIIVYEGTQTIAQNYPDLLDKHPEIKAFRARFEQIDGLKQYLASRPRLDF